MARTTKPSPRRRTLDRAEVERRLLAGETQAQIAAALGVTQPAVSRALKRWGLSESAGGNMPARPDRPHYPRTPEGYRALRQRLGLTQQQLADRLGKSREAVSGRETGSSRYPIDEEAALALLHLVESG